jgi:hypothetical protein
MREGSPRLAVRPFSLNHSGRCHFRSYRILYIEFQLFTWISIYTVINMLAFLYQLNNGFSPFRVSVSSMYAQRLTKSSWLVTWVSLPVTAR